MTAVERDAAGKLITEDDDDDLCIGLHVSLCMAGQSADII